MKLNYLDEMFGKFAEAFLGNMAGDGDIPFRERLNISTLNYSLDSLIEVNSYLEFIFKESIHTANIEYQNLVVWGGSYIGEVIRRNAITKFHWVDYREYMKDKDQGLKNLIPYTLGTHALLAAQGTFYVTMPLNKVARFLDEGNVHNVHFYASADISRK